MNQTDKKTQKRVAGPDRRALLYTPYLDVLGGGERHILSIMSVLAKNGYNVDIAWDDENIQDKLKETLHFDTSQFNIIPNFITSKKTSKRMQQLSHYDVFVYVTDGSYFFSRARKNVIFGMYPDRKLYSLFPINWMKLHNYDLVVNSEFTAKYVSNWLHKKATVLHPYIAKDFFTHAQTKKRSILTVGRMFKHLHSKRQDVLIEAFKLLTKNYQQFSDFTLYIVGGLKDEDKDYYQELQRRAQGFDIVIKPNVSYQELLKMYSEAMIYWHAAGFDVDEKKHPDRVEHLGITPLEAMASRCLTICHESGGPKNYISQGENGFLYSSIDDLMHKTVSGYNELEKATTIIDNARRYVSAHFSYPVFKNKVEQYFRL